MALLGARTSCKGGIVMEYIFIAGVVVLILALFAHFLYEFYERR